MCKLPHQIGHYWLLKQTHTHTQHCLLLPTNVRLADKVKKKNSIDETLIARLCVGYFCCEFIIIIIITCLKGTLDTRLIQLQVFTFKHRFLFPF